jgi:hypothetical protein
MKRFIAVFALLTTIALAGGTQVPNLDISNATTTQFGTVRKTVDETYDNTTLQNDDELLLAVSANSVYEFILIFHANTQTGEDLKFGWSVPSGTTMKWGSSTNGDTRIESTSLNITTDATDTLYFFGTIVVSSTAGNVNFQWAEQADSGAETTVYANSCLIWWKLA